MPKVQPTRNMWWRKLLVGDTINHRILRSTFVIAALTLVVRAFGFAREIAIAGYFGTSDEVDAYLMAFLLPNFVISVLAGSINAAFIPTFVAVRQIQGRESAHRLLGSVVLSTAILLTALTLLLLGSADHILSWLAPSFSQEKVALTLRLYFWLSPVIVLQGVITIWSAVLNADSEFALAAIMPAIATVIALAFLLAGVKSLGIYSLALGFLTGFCVQAATLGWRIASRGYSLTPSWNGWTPELRHVLRQYLPVVAGSFLLSGTNLVEHFMAASLPAGSVASLGYASRLTGVANGICAMALGTAVLPYFSALVAKADWVTVRHTLRTYRWIIFIFGGLAATVLVAVSEPLVIMLFCRGNFSFEDAQMVANLQRSYAFQLPFCAAGILLVRLISALGENRYLMWGALISLSLNIALNSILASHFGLIGVALTNSFMYILSFIYLSFVVRYLLSQRVPKDGLV